MRDARKHKGGIGLSAGVVSQSEPDEEDDRRVLQSRENQGKHRLAKTEIPSHTRAAGEDHRDKGRRDKVERILHKRVEVAVQFKAVVAEIKLGQAAAEHQDICQQRKQKEKYAEPRDHVHALACGVSAA